MNKKFVYKVGNDKKSYTMMHGQPNIIIIIIIGSTALAGLWPS
jgi:hypothetical protein